MPAFHHDDGGHPELALIQARMPVIIENADWRVWLSEKHGDVKVLLGPLPADQLEVWPVSRKVTLVKSDGPELLEPLPERGVASGAPIGAGPDLRQAAARVGATRSWWFATDLRPEELGRFKQEIMGKRRGNTNRQRLESDPRSYAADPDRGGRGSSAVPDV